MERHPTKALKSVMRTVLLGGLAMFALSGIAAASASAYTNPILENAKGEHVSKAKFTGLDEARSFPVVEREFSHGGECSKEAGTGELSTTGTGAAASTSGTATLLFKNCKASLGKCTTSGKNAGEVEVKVALSLVWVGKESEEEPGLRAAIVPLSAKPGNGEGAKLEMKCWGDTFATEGAFIGPLSRGLGKEFTKTAFIATSIGEYPVEQRYKKYTEEGKEAEIHLYSSWGKTDFEQTGTIFEEEQTYGETVKIAKS
jgi:hypothetical protein